MTDAIMVVPVEVNDITLTASNIPENDHPAWTSGTNYTAGDWVIRTTTHSIYEAVNSGVSTVAPENDPEGWLRVGATNRFRAFDGSIGQVANRLDVITYTIAPGRRCDTLALVSMNASSVRVVVKDGAGVVKYDQTKDLVDTSGISDWKDYFEFESEYQPEHVFTTLPVNADGSVEITITTSTGTVAEVGEIVLGKAVSLGVILDQSRSGYTDYTLRNQDAFGNITFTVRPTARRAEWQILFPTRSNRRIQRELEKARGVTCYFHPGDDMSEFYIGVLGVADDFFPALSAAGETRATLSLTGTS